MINEEIKIEKEVNLKFENNSLLLHLSKIFKKIHELVNMRIIGGDIHFGLRSHSNCEIIFVKIPNACDPNINMELIGINTTEFNKALTKFKKEFDISIKDTIILSSGSKSLQIPIYETDYGFQDVNLPNPVEVTTSPLHFVELIDICSFTGSSIKFTFKDQEIIGTSKENSKIATSKIICSTISKNAETIIATDKIKMCLELFKDYNLIKLTTDTESPMIVESVDMPYSIKYIIAPRVEND